MGRDTLGTLSHTGLAVSSLVVIVTLIDELERERSRNGNLGASDDTDVLLYEGVH